MNIVPYLLNREKKATIEYPEIEFTLQIIYLISDMCK